MWSMACLRFYQYFLTRLQKNKTMIEIQQSEVHLHPKVQATLGDVFLNSQLEIQGKDSLLKLIATT
jgi:predicted ATP-dependent endonuclease of OLD family